MQSIYVFISTIDQVLSHVVLYRKAVAMGALLNYWKARLANVPILKLPIDRQMPAVQSFRRESRQIRLSPDLVERAKALSRCEGVTLFMTLVGAFQVLLHRYSGQDNVVICTSHVGSCRSEIEKLNDFFGNTLVLCTDLSSNPSCLDLLVRVRDATLEAYANKDVSFEKLVKTLHLQRDRSQNPLFQVMFILQDYSDNESQSEVNLESLQADSGTAQFELVLELLETSSGLVGRLEYATDLFETATIARMIGHFQTLLEGIIAHPQARLSELPLLTARECQQVLIDWNDTAATFPRDKCIHELFETQAGETPDAVALVYEDGQLTYAQLNAKANQLAHHLRELGIKPDVLVAICVERSLNMVVGLLAILKAGGAYVPLDPSYPKERLAFMLKDCDPLVLLTQGKLESLFEGMTKALPVIDLEADSLPWAVQPDINLNRYHVGLTSTHLAYVIYTSGSTGVPKGVMIEHKGVCNMITDLIKRYTIGNKDRLLQFASIAFDVSVEEIFVALISGASLVLRNENWLAGDASEFWALCEKNGISIVNLPTFFWQQLIQEDQAVIPSTINAIIIGSEAVHSQALAAWFERKGYRPKLFNAYGPTETTVNATIHELSTDSLSWQSIGRPIANTHIYILDANNQPTPIGVPGELFISGEGLARGYLNRPVLTAERFVADPFTAQAGAHMYKTGDLARWLANGTIEFLGRNDFQVKIRGFRIELGDIEAKLQQHPQLQEVVVDTYQPASGDQRLVAYLVSKSSPAASPSELRGFLEALLPEFMIPSYFLFLDALPLTPNGKVDRKALPEPEQSQLAIYTEFIPPRNPVEKQLVKIWRKILEVDRIGIHNNFFYLGGHSLLAAKTVVEINETFNTDLPLGIIYQFPTVEQLGRTLSSGILQPSYYSLVPIHIQGSRPPLFAIHTITLENLPRYLGKDQPLYFIRYGMGAESNNHAVQLPKLEDLADHYIKEMQQVQPHGPYHLLGFSFGGIIAYEMACQLAANGCQVSFLGLLDTHLKTEKQRLPLYQIIQKLFGTSPGGLLEMIRNKITDQARSYKYGADFWPHIYTSAPDMACHNGYQPKNYDGHVTLFQGWEEESMFYKYTLAECAWRLILGDNLEVQQIPGMHYEIFNEPHVKTLAEKILACFPN
ncbi:MAG: non-ribosomal peptide synthetase [Methylobacter sp.]